MKHGREIMVTPGLQYGADHPELASAIKDPAKRASPDLFWQGLSMPIGLYRYLYPCRCKGGFCKCEAGK